MSAKTLKAVADELTEALDGLTFKPPVTHVYNPYLYARVSVDAYIDAWADGPTEVLLVGMNPGPWGMAQTGVPFGEIDHVRDFVGVHEEVGKPEGEHPKRPVDGFDCHRSEVSGRRLWGWAKERFGTAEAFFSRFFVYNYCPLLFLEKSGRNRTPVRLKAAERRSLFPPCDRALRRVAEALEPTWVVGVGRFANERAAASCEGLDVQVGRILHPSPASPKANKGWARQAEAQLEAMGVAL